MGEEETMGLRKLTLLGAALVSAGIIAATTAEAQNEQFIPGLVYRTGAYAPNGIPFADGVADYIAMLNARDGGINGVKITFEECETGYATDRGVECYERLKGHAPTGASYFSPLSTGITFALTEKAPGDKIPLITMGYGRADSRDGAVFEWNFPLLGTYWTAANVAIQHIAKEMGGFDKLKGKKIALLYHDSPYGKEPIAALEVMAKKYGFDFLQIPVAAPGTEQKSQWLQIRQQKPDYVLLWGWGIMNSAAVTEAGNVNYPRDKMIGVWWSGAEPDVIPAGEKGAGYKALMLQHPAGKSPVYADLEKFVIAPGKSLAKPDEIGSVLYNRGLINSMLGTESIRTAMAKFGNKPMTGEQVRWGIEHLDLTAARIKELGFEGMIGPIKVSCADHEGTRLSRVHQWDGKKWNVISDWYTADDAVIEPLVKETAGKYATEKKITPRDCSKES
jgi:branched-chain amino acid transport system substrate-binding protein